MKLKLLLISLTFLAVFSCKEESKNAQMGGIDLDSVFEKVEGMKGGDHCLMSYSERLDELITEDQILKLSGFSKDKLTVELDDIFKNPKYANYVFSFANGRDAVLEAMGRRIEHIAEDKFSVGEIQEISKEDFMASHRPATEEEIEAAKKAIRDAEVEKVQPAEVEDAEINWDKIMDGAMDSMVSVMSEHSASNRRIDGLGELAVYNLMDKQLTVYSNGVMFTVMADASNDEKKNREYAIELAKMVLAKCK